MSPSRAHLHLARTCIAHVVSCRPQAFHGLFSGDATGSQCDFLLPYAAMYWPKHARMSLGLAEALIDEYASFFMAESASRDAWLQQCSTKKISHMFNSTIDIFGNQNFYGPTTNSSLLSLACYLGITPWVSRILYSEGAWDQKDSAGFVPLRFAAAQGHVGIMRLLLSHGAKVSAETSDEPQPLHFRIST